MGGNNAYCFAKFNELARSEIASIAHRTNPAAALAGKNRTNLQALHAHPLKFCGDLFIDQLIRFDDFFLLVHRVSDRLAAYASDNALAKIDYFFVAFVNRAHHDTVYRTAVVFIDDHVLRRVHQFARQITGVGSLERCVGKTFASAVSRNKILEHAESLAEVRRDRALDDFA